MSAKKKILYAQTSGVDTPESTYAPFILAAIATAMGLEPTIYLVIKGITIVKKSF
jgi:predicted peroxiredoxin